VIRHSRSGMEFRKFSIPKMSAVIPGNFEDFPHYFWFSILIIILNFYLKFSINSSLNHGESTGAGSTDSLVLHQIWSMHCARLLSFKAADLCTQSAMNISN